MKSNIFFTLLCLAFCSNFSLAQDAQEATLLGHWSGEGLVGSSAYNNTYNEIWGVTRNGHEYAVIGSTAGTHFVDVTDPTQPTEAFFLPGNANGPQIIHRDYHDIGDYLYAVADEGASTMQIIDISQLPDTVQVVYDSGEHLQRAHNIFIDETNARLYTFATKGGSSSYSAMRIFDIADPFNIEMIGSYGSLGAVDIGHVHDGYVRDHIAFLNCGNDGFAVVDCTNPLELKLLNFLNPTNYPQAGYNHSGWLNDECTHYYMADENWGRAMKTLDVRDVRNIEVKNTFNAGSDSQFSIPHNQIVACNYLYVSHYYDGLQIYDISTPAIPRRVAYYNTSQITHRRNYEGAWGVYPLLPSGNILVSDMQRGLFILEGMGDNCDPQANIMPCDLTSAVEALEESKNHINIYPQPTHDFISLNITLEKARKNTSIQLYDWSGRLVETLWSGNLQAGEQVLDLELRQATAGMYLLKMQNEEVFLAKKVVVN